MNLNNGKKSVIKWTQDTIIIKLKELHPKLDFSQFIFTSVNNKSIIICPEHGPREMKVMNLLRGSSCKACRPQSQKRIPARIIKQMEEKHLGKYSYPTFKNYTNQNQIIEILCPEHGIFEQQVIHHTNGSGCEKCHDRSFNRKDLEYHVSLIPSEHSNDYNYLNVHYNYNGSNSTFLEIECKEFKHKFIQNLSNHKNGSGCPFCSEILNESRGIKIIKNFLNLNNLKFETEKTFIDCINENTGYKLRFDIYLTDLNCCIEFDGYQHFKAVALFGGEEELIKTKFRDNIKNEYCKINNINLIRISYNDKNIKKILKERLNLK